MKKIICLIVLLFVTTACNNKSALSAAEFKKVARENNYHIVDAISQFKDYGYIKTSLIAIEDEKDYQIEFYVLEDEDNAIAFYNLNKSTLEASYDKDSIVTNKDNKYILDNTDSYKVISRRDSTVIYIDVDNEYKGNVKKFLNKIGY